MNVNGELTLGENIGDLVRPRRGVQGLPAVARRQAGAGDRRLHRRPALLPRLGAGLARKYREDELRKRLVTDPHSPSEYRSNGIVRNMPAFAEAFEVKAGDKLYLPADQQVRIW